MNSDKPPIFPIVCIERYIIAMCIKDGRSMRNNGGSSMSTLPESVAGIAMRKIRRCDMGGSLAREKILPAFRESETIASRASDESRELSPVAEIDFVTVTAARHAGKKRK